MPFVDPGNIFSYFSIYFPLLLKRFFATFAFVSFINFISVTITFDTVDSEMKHFSVLITKRLAESSIPYP